MFSRATVGRQAQRALKRSWQHQPKRGLAEPASGMAENTTQYDPRLSISTGSFQYQVGEVSGTKFATREIPGPVATLALVSSAGTRFQPLPGLAEGLERYAFKVRK
jgi:ubiquinol-cytochrome c reductase core subunit 2